MISIFLYGVGLEIIQSFPCQCDLTSTTEGPAVEREVSNYFQLSSECCKIT